jgi:hypothetical protein
MRMLKCSRRIHSLDACSRCFKVARLRVPSTVTADLYNQVSTAYFTAVNEILTGQVADAGARVAQLAEQLEGIVAQL